MITEQEIKQDFDNWLGWLSNTIRRLDHVYNDLVVQSPSDLACMVDAAEGISRLMDMKIRIKSSPMLNGGVGKEGDKGNGGT